MSGIVGDNTARASGVIASAGGGKILQVVNAIKTDSSTFGTSWADVSNLSVAITPSDTSSKIYIDCRVMLTASSGAFLKLLRDVGGAGYVDSTYIGETVGSRVPSINMIQDWGHMCAGIGYLDTTNTTSEVTYKLQAKGDHATHWCGVNRGKYPDNNTNDWGRGASSITAYEVGA